MVLISAVLFISLTYALQKDPIKKKQVSMNISTHKATKRSKQIQIF